MNYSEPLISQVTVFFRSLGCGILLGVFYDVFSAARMTFGEKKSVYIFFDITYFIFASLVSFFFMVLYNSGQVRLNIMLAELFGAGAFHYSLGKYVLKRYALQLKCVRKIFAVLTKPFAKTALNFYGFCAKFFKDTLKVFYHRKKSKKSEKNS